MVYSVREAYHSAMIIFKSTIDHPDGCPGKGQGRRVECKAGGLVRACTEDPTHTSKVPGSAPPPARGAVHSAEIEYAMGEPGDK